MIDTWLVAAIVFAVLALCILFRSIPARSRDDQLVAGTVAVSLAAAAALTLSIAWSSLLILDLAILGAALSFVVLIRVGTTTGGDRA
jgi:multisubunit Na+/H+ antiporter MnhF subunit